jgi:predicted membrane GTPase involved in stress response
MQCAWRDKHHRVARDTGVEEAIAWIADDEPREVTPHPIRIAKKSSSDVSAPYAVGT